MSEPLSATLRRLHEDIVRPDILSGPAECEESPNAILRAAEDAREAALDALPALADLVKDMESIEDFACHWQPTHPKATDPTCPPCIASRALAALRERLGARP